MAFSSGTHIFTAWQAKSRGFTGTPSNNGGNAGPGRCLCLFSAKAAAHTAHFYSDRMKRNTEHFRHQFLGLTGVLVRGMNHHPFILRRHHNARLALEIEVLLPTDK